MTNPGRCLSCGGMGLSCVCPLPPRETIDHPPHYERGGVEAIDVIEAWCLDFHLGNALKYISRAGRKGSAVEDIEKAIWYLRRWVDKRKPTANSESVTPVADAIICGTIGEPYGSGVIGSSETPGERTLIGQGRLKNVPDGLDQDQTPTK